MTKDLRTARIPAPMVEKATDGGASMTSQRNWQRSGYFRTHDLEMPEPRAGKPRQFTLLHVYEAAMLANASRIGFPLQVVADAFAKRIEIAGIRQIQKETPGLGGAIAFFEGEVVEAAIRSGELREFEKRPADNAAYWVINMRGAPDDGQPTFDNLIISNNAGLPAAMRDAEFRRRRSDPQPHVINVTDIVNNIDEALHRLGIDVGSDA